MLVGFRYSNVYFSTSSITGNMLLYSAQICIYICICKYDSCACIDLSRSP